jgi:F0F1-type ATP synthase assembly protein I
MGDLPARQIGLWTLVSIGSYNVAALLIGFALGWWADSRLDTTPACTLGGLAVGIAVGVVGSWLRIRAFLRE